MESVPWGSGISFDFQSDLCGLLRFFGCEPNDILTLVYCYYSFAVASAMCFRQHLIFSCSSLLVVLFMTSASLHGKVVKCLDAMVGWLLSTCG